MTRALRARQSLVVQDFTDSCVVVDPVADEAHVLNASAAFVFHCCSGELDEQGIAALLSAEAHVPLEVATADVRACLQTLRVKKLLDVD